MGRGSFSNPVVLRFFLQNASVRCMCSVLSGISVSYRSHLHQHVPPSLLLLGLLVATLFTSTRASRGPALRMMEAFFDCALHTCPWCSGDVRLESVQTGLRVRGLSYEKGLQTLRVQTKRCPTCKLVFRGCWARRPGGALVSCGARDELLVPLPSTTSRERLGCPQSHVPAVRDGQSPASARFFQRHC